MTDRVNAITVFLKNEMRDDDVEALTNAILMLKNVTSVSTHVTDISAVWAYEKARRELYDGLVAVLYPKEDIGP